MRASTSAAWRGPLLMLAGYLQLGLVPVLVRSLREVGWHSAQTVAGRFAIACLFVLSLVVLRRRSLEVANRRLLIWRGVWGALAVLFFFTAIQLAGAAMGTLLNYTFPIWANVFGLLVFKQKPVPGFWALALLALSGVYLVVSPDFRHPEWGQLAGVVSGMFAGAGVLCVKAVA